MSNQPTKINHLEKLRPTVGQLPESGIVELVNMGREKEGLMPLWVGEGQWATPSFICEEAARSMAAGETFYTYQRGIPELREALAHYHHKVYGIEMMPERFFVTGSGMQAVQLCLQALIDKGDEIIIPTPAWPNIAAAATVAGARVVEVGMHPPNREAKKEWRLDLNDLEQAISPKTRVIFLNSPSNPTGWTASLEELTIVLDLARKHDLWIIADEVYSRFYYGNEKHHNRAPSFYDVIDEDDQVLFVNTFSKNWAMTGWRIGWISGPPILGQVFENLIQFSTSGVAAFMQRAVLAALQMGEPFVIKQVEAARRSRDVLCQALGSMSAVNFSKPSGAFYLFFEVEGMTDSRDLAVRLMNEALLGLAPGTAFGKGGETYVRLCFARSPEEIKIASDRLTRWLIENI